MYRITELAKRFGLSRSTLLYYDRIGLLSPAARSESRYRLYSSADAERLERVCALRQAGLEIEDIRAILAAPGDDSTDVLQRRLQTLGDEIRALQAKQRILAGMLRLEAEGGPKTALDKEMFVQMLRAAGIDDEAMKQLHTEFERREPAAHHNFLRLLGISEQEAMAIRRWSAG